MTSQLRPGEVLAALDESYSRVTTAVTPLQLGQFLRPTLTEGWVVADLLFHLLLDAQRALVALASPTDAAADVDFVTYWRPFRPDVGAEARLAHARFVRLCASAYSKPTVLVEQWTQTAAATVYAARATDWSGRVVTQGHVIAVPDFVVTLAVEATIHYLDLTAHLMSAAPADPAGLALVRRTLDGLLGMPLPLKWTDEEYAVKGTGRGSLTEAERAALGEAAQRLPLLG